MKRLRKILPLLLYVCSMLTWSGCDKNDGIAPDKKAHDKENPNSGAVVKKDNDIQVYVHFMPWFETDVSNNGKWGYHWTMKNCNPNIVDAEGRLLRIIIHRRDRTLRVMKTCSITSCC